MPVEEEEKSKSNSALLAEVHNMVEKFVVGMLKTFGTLSVDRIQTMLSQYAESYTLSIQELSSFLHKLVREDKLEMIGKDFSLKK